MTSQADHVHTAPSPTAPTPVSVLGLGSLGTTLAAALLIAGHPVTVWNRTTGKADDLAQRGAGVAASTTTAVAASPIVVAAVSTYDDTRAILEPVGDTLAGRTLVNLSSGTPEQAQAMADWTAKHGVDYLDGAAMSGTRLVGDPSALFLYSGPAGAFARSRNVLTSLGRAVHLGSDAGMTSLYDTALLTMNLGLLGGFYHAAALTGTAGVEAAELAAVATDYLPFAVDLLADHAVHADERRYPGEDGTLNVFAAAMDHVVVTSRRLGLSTDIPAGVQAVIERAVTAGHGDDGLARLIAHIPVTG